VTPAPLLREERLVLVLAEDRVKRAAVLGVLFLVLGVGGIWMNAGGRADGWYPFLGVPVAMVAAIGYIWWTARCPRCGMRVLAGRRRTPGTCPRCGVALTRSAAEKLAAGDGDADGLDRSPPVT